MLDTNIEINILKRRPIELLEVLNCHADQMYISATTHAKILHGAEKSEKLEHNLQQVKDFVSRLIVLEYTSKAASHYGEIRANLARRGTTIELNDLHIACHPRCEAADVGNKRPARVSTCRGVALGELVLRHVDFQ